MGIGAYRHLVTLEHPAVVLDPATWYCSLQSAASQVIDGQAAYFVRGRYHPGLTLETQINFEGRTFQVQSVTDLDERHVDVQLLCVEVVGRGVTPAELRLPPTITTQPQGATVTVGESVTLTVVAAGTPPLEYQWLEEGVDIAGATSASYVTGPLEATASYAVEVTNAYGTVTSTPVTITVEAPSYQATVLADGALAYWPLDDVSGTTARDLAGARPGTITAGVTLNQPGVTASNPSMKFNGTGKINVPPIPAIHAGHTFEAWVLYPRGGDFNSGYILARPVFTAGGFALSMTSFSSLPSRCVCNYQTAANLVGNWTIPYDVWHHIVVTHDGTTANLYVDAAFYFSSPASFTDVSATTPLEIGFATAFGAVETITLQDVAVYLRALTPAEIAAHYALRLED